MKRVTGTFDGTGSALTVALGFKPDYVKVQNIESATLEAIEWHTNLGLTAVYGGIKSVGITDNGTTTTKAFSKLAYGDGISRYDGAETLTAASTSILVADPNSDKRSAGSGAAVASWTLGNAGNRTGNFNAGVSTSVVGPGSQVLIGHVQGAAKWYTIVALTNDGDAANEVTLDGAPASGTVWALTGMNTFVGASAGIVTPEGFTIDETTDVNVSGERCFFVAEQYV